jgi:hypothetical protein
MFFFYSMYVRRSPQDFNMDNLLQGEAAARGKRATSFSQPCSGLNLFCDSKV